MSENYSYLARSYKMTYCTPRRTGNDYIKKIRERRNIGGKHD